MTLYEFPKFFAEEKRRKSAKKSEERYQLIHRQQSDQHIYNNVLYEQEEQSFDNLDNVYSNDERFSEDFKTMGRSIR